MNVGVIGAGIFGIAAALELRDRGHTVTVFERGKVPHEKASSTDVSKAIRRTGYGANDLTYGSDEAYVELVERAAPRWRDWHERLSGHIYHQVGHLCIVSNFERGTPRYASWEYLTGRGAAIEVLTAKEARTRFPQFAYEEGDTCLYDAWGGYLESGQAMTDLAGLARTEGVKIREDSAVTRVEETPSGVQLLLDDGQLEFDRAVVAVGVWMNVLVPQIGRHVTLSRQQMAFLEPLSRESFDPKNFPVWSVDGFARGWYGFPLLREGYVKIADNFGVHTGDPDADRENTADFLDDMKAFLERRMPELAKGKLVGGHSCYYANTPDHNFIIDWVPGTQRVLVAGGGSGHGFKFGGSIGEVIADVLEDKANRFYELFRIGKRFE